MKQIVLVVLLLISTFVSAEGIYKSFVVSNELFERYKVNYPKLKVGMEPEQAHRLLGKPHYETELIDKKGVNKGLVYRYYVTKKHPDLVNETFDKYISIYFDPNGKLVNAQSHNLSEFHEIGSQH
jgi:outer membrane protein assembly factor BamE (lipoprotein component of BamABCDE complex)